MTALSLAEEENMPVLPDKLPEHPRIFLTKQRIVEIKEQDKTDSFLDKTVKELIQKANRLKKETVSEYNLPEGVQESVRWGMITRSEIALNGKSATLTLNSKTLTATMESNNVEKLEIASTVPPKEIENQNKGYSMLTAFAEPKDGKIEMTVTLKTKK
jgi:hypothetical protein